MLGLYEGGQASHRKAMPLTGRAVPVTGRPGISQGGWASHREAGPLTRRQASHRLLNNLTKIQKKGTL